MSELEAQWLFFGATFLLTCTVLVMFVAACYYIVENADELRYSCRQAVKSLALPICYQVDYRSKGLSFSKFEVDVMSVGLENCLVFKVMKCLN